MDNAAFADGAEVTVIAGDDDEQFTASAEQEADILAAIAEVARGEVESAADLLARRCFLSTRDCRRRSQWVWLRD